MLDRPQEQPLRDQAHDERRDGEHEAQDEGEIEPEQREHAQQHDEGERARFYDRGHRLDPAGAVERAIGAERAERAADRRREDDGHVEAEPDRHARRLEDRAARRRQDEDGDPVGDAGHDL